MSKPLKYKLRIDILMTVFLLLLMSYGLFGEEYHEWIGVGMFLLFVLHHILNRKWISNIGKGKYTAFRILQTILVIAILLTMLGAMVSGILLSRYVFSFIHIHGIAIVARNIHMFCTYWSFILMSLHLGLHWSIMLGIVRKKIDNLTPIYIWSIRVIGLVIAIYGGFAFIKRGIADYMFLQVHFAFFDYQESLFVFLIDYLAVMGCFVFWGYYVGKGLRRLNKNK